MPIFTYKAIDKFGKEVTGDIEATGYNEAIKKVRNLGYFPTKIAIKKLTKASRAKMVLPGHAKAGPPIAVTIPFLGIGTVKPKQLTLFTRQLATLIDAGLPLVRSLNILRDQMKTGPFRDVIDDLARQVEAGGTFSESLLKYPRIFSPLFVNTVKAGETGGVLEVVLRKLAEFSEKAGRLRGTIKAALVYPALVVTIAMGVLTFLIIFVIPKFMELFEEIGSELPLPTLILMRVSKFFQQQWIVGVLAVVGMTIIFNFVKRAAPVKYLIDRTKLHLPVFGILIQKASIARFARTLGTLISSGVPILQAILITKDTAGNEVITRSLAKVHNSIREGESIAGPLSKTKIFPLMVVNMISVGEETGSLDQMLNKIADTYDEEVDTAVGALTSLMEPILIVFMGLIVGGIVISMFLPLVKLLTALGG